MEELKWQKKWHGRQRDLGDLKEKALYLFLKFDPTRSLFCDPISSTVLLILLRDHSVTLHNFSFLCVFPSPKIVSATNWQFLLRWLPYWKKKKNSTTKPGCFLNLCYHCPYISSRLKTMESLWVSFLLPTSHIQSPEFVNSSIVLSLATTRLFHFHCQHPCLGLYFLAWTISKVSHWPLWLQFLHL